MTDEKAMKRMQEIASALKGRVEDKCGTFCLDRFGMRLSPPGWKIDICINDTGNLAVYPKKGGAALCIVPLKSMKDFTYEPNGSEANFLIRLNRIGLIRILAS